MAMSPALPPTDGSVSLHPGFADFQAQYNPDAPCIVFPSSDSAKDVKTISFLEFAEATHRTAHLLRPERKGPEGEVVALLIHTDSLLYVALLAGMLRAGLVALPMSPRNSPQAICSMLRRTSCHRMLSQSSLSALVSQVQAECQNISHGLTVEDFPSPLGIFPEIFGQGTGEHANFEPYPPRPSAHDDSDVIMYVHSSGSTGYPKPIPYTQRILMQAYGWNTIRGACDRRVRFGGMACPPFHLMGIVVQLSYPFISGQAVALFPPQWPAQPVVPHVQNTLETSKLTRTTALVAVPSFLEAWVHDQGAVDYLKTLAMVLFGGGPLSKKTGDRLAAAGVKFVPAFGGTEFGGPTLAFPEDKPRDAPVEVDTDWEYTRFSSNIRTRLVPQGDGTYELQVLTSDNYALAVENLPDTRGYATSDLFTPHPTKPGLWKVVGRKDDVIVLSTGEKIVPLQQEEHITVSPLVMGAVMFGREHAQPGLLVEPYPQYAIDPDNPNALAEFRNKIWPSVEVANAPAPAFARIFKEMILVTKPDKPLPRAAKGTIIRKQATDLYAEEIETLYEAVDNSSDAQGIAPPTSWEESDLEEWLTEHATSVNGGRVPLPTIPLFDQGFDSLSATFMRNRIVGSLRNAGELEVRKAASTVGQNLVFEFPTIKQLAYAVSALVDPSSVLVDSRQSRAQEMEELVCKYTASLPAKRGRQANDAGAHIIVLLTGSTGNIGSHILASLLGDKRITKVYTLNRPSTSNEDRLVTAFQDRNLPAELLSQPKLSSLTGDICQDNFGLSLDVYEEIKRSVTHIIHNAWTVNFNYALRSFESQIAGVRKLLDIFVSSNQHVRLLFTSSVGAANGWDSSRGPVPEMPLDDPTVGAGTGYSASKYVVEQILAKAADSGLSLMALRMGQACGPKSTGAWGTTEWVPIMVKSSLALGCLPRMEGSVSWVPLDAIGNMYLDLLTARGPLPPVINVVHPRLTTWNEILDGMWEELGGRLPFVSLQEWVDKLDALPTEVSSDVLQQIPALKLRPFFRGLASTVKQHRGAEGSAEVGEDGGGAPLYQTSELQRCSPTMQQLPPIDRYHARMWVKYWQSKKYI